MTTSQLKSTALRGMSGVMVHITLLLEFMGLSQCKMAGLSSFYVLGGYSRDISSEIDLIYRFDEDTYKFVELDQRLPYPADFVLGMMVTMD